MLYSFDKNLQLKSKTIYEGEENSGAYGESSPKYKNTTIKSWKLVKKGKDLFVIIRAYNYNKTNKTKLQTIKKRVE